MPGADASRPAAGAKTRDGRISLRFVALSARLLNAQNHQFVFSRTSRSTTVAIMAKADRGAAGGTAACRPVANSLFHERLTQAKARRRSAESPEQRTSSRLRATS